MLLAYDNSNSWGVSEQSRLVIQLSRSWHLQKILQTWQPIIVVGRSDRTLRTGLLALLLGTTGRY